MVWLAPKYVARSKYCKINADRTFKVKQWDSPPVRSLRSNTDASRIPAISINSISYVYRDDIGRVHLTCEKNIVDYSLVEKTLAIWKALQKIIQEKLSSVDFTIRYK